MSSLLKDLKNLASFQDANDDSDVHETDSAKTPAIGCEPTPINESENTPFLAFIQKETKAKRKKDIQTLFNDIDDFLGPQTDDFSLDTSLDSIFEDDSENVSIRNSLIAQGRRYAREHAVSDELSEVEKAFSPQEKALRNLIDEIVADEKGVQKDIDALRMSRTRNTKSLADLIDSKGSLINARLSAIKEINKIRKDMIDIRMKQNAAKKDVEASDTDSYYAVQKILNYDNSSSPISLQSISGATSESGESPISDSVEYDDDLIQAKYFPSEEETEGDKYIKYENRHVQLHLQIDSEGNKKVVPIDQDGIIVDDYPIPEGADTAEYTINEETGIARDKSFREFILDRI